APALRRPMAAAPGHCRCRLNWQCLAQRSGRALFNPAKICANRAVAARSHARAPRDETFIAEQSSGCGTAAPSAPLAGNSAANTGGKNDGAGTEALGDSRRLHSRAKLILGSGAGLA